MTKILIIDDEKNVRRILRDYFENEGFHVIEGHGGAHGITQALENNDLDLILLDIRMPEIDGFEVMSELKKYIDVPIVFLTALGDDFNEIKGLELGADDYIAKPFNYKVLMARVNKILRTNQKADQLIRSGPLTINPSSHTITVNEVPCELTLKEYELLMYLYANKGINMERLKILERLWGFDYDGDPRTVDTHIKTLRAKLGVMEQAIKTVRGIGYRFDEI